ncbi:MAG: hypothetical protein Q8Q31_05315 [Nanoarchaeota archaeon]|nr:hypothetical protein [Nanoarchaeota archaeon]
MKKQNKSLKKKESVGRIVKKSKAVSKKSKKPGKVGDWEKIIPKDQLSGSTYTGVESGEIKETTEKNLEDKGIEVERMRDILPSPKGSAQHESAWEDPDLGIATEPKREDLGWERKDDPDFRLKSRSQEIIATPGQYIEVNFESLDKNKRILRGKVIEMYSDRAVPEIDNEVVGTSEDPALLIEIYEEMSNGKWNPTGKLIGMKMSEIQRRVQVFNER